MRITEVRISEWVAEKTQAEHGVLPDEAEEVLFSHPVVRRARDGRYLAIGMVDRYPTVIFEFEKGAAEIVTASPSSNWQIRLYKRSKRRRR